MMMYDMMRYERCNIHVDVRVSVRVSRSGMELVQTQCEIMRKRKENGQGVNSNRMTAWRK